MKTETVNDLPGSVHPVESADCEYICLDISRTESTEIYMAVPKGWKPTYKDNATIVKAAKETHDFDWDKFGWENNVEVNGYRTVDASEAKQFGIFDARPHLLTT